MKELGKDRTPDEEAAVTNRGFRYYYEMRGVTTRVQLQALDYLWMVINAWLVGLLPPCSTHCNVPVWYPFRYVEGQWGYADNGCYGI